LEEGGRTRRGEGKETIFPFLLAEKGKGGKKGKRVAGGIAYSYIILLLHRFTGGEMRGKTIFWEEGGEEKRKGRRAVLYLFLVGGGTARGGRNDISPRNKKEEGGNEVCSRRFSSIISFKSSLGGGGKPQKRESLFLFLLVCAFLRKDGRKGGSLINSYPEEE